MIIQSTNKVVTVQNDYEVTREIANAMAPSRPKTTVPPGSQPYTITPRGSILGKITTPHGIPVKGK